MGADREGSGGDRRRPGRADPGVLEAQRADRGRPRRHGRRVQGAGGSGSVALGAGGDGTRSIRWIHGRASPVPLSPIWPHGGRPKRPPSAGTARRLLGVDRRRPDATYYTSWMGSRWPKSLRWCRRPDPRGRGPMCCGCSATCSRPVSETPGRRWLDVLERAADHTVASLIDLDPAEPVATRKSDGRSLWIHPMAPRFTSEAVLAEEEYVLSWAMSAQTSQPAPSATVDPSGLDVLQAEAAAAVAGADRFVLVVGAAGAGKTRMLARRRRRPGPSGSGRVRVGADSQGGPCPRTRHRHRGRHRGQAAARMAALRPATRPLVSPAGRCDRRRRRSRRTVHPRPAPARQAGRT